jgi:hypothetical protein
MRVREPGEDGIPGQYDYEVRTGLALYDLEGDVGERENVAAEHPEVVGRLQDLARRRRLDLGDALEGVEGGGAREPARGAP